MALLNGHFLFKPHREEVYASQIPAKYSLLEFKEDVVRQLAGLEECGESPCYQYAPKDKPDFKLIICQFLVIVDTPVGYAMTKKKQKERFFLLCCTSMQGFLHCTVQKNCFQEWHITTYIGSKCTFAHHNNLIFRELVRIELII